MSEPVSDNHITNNHSAHSPEVRLQIISKDQADVSPHVAPIGQRKLIVSATGCYLCDLYVATKEALAVLEPDQEAFHQLKSLQHTLEWARQLGAKSNVLFVDVMQKIGTIASELRF